MSRLARSAPDGVFTGEGPNGMRELLHVDYEIRFEISPAGGPPRARVRSIAGEQAAEVRVPERLFDPATLSGLARAVRKGGRSVELVDEPAVSPREYGQELYRALFSGALGEHLGESWGRARAPGAGLRLRIVADLEEPNLARLARLPWELLHDGGKLGFLAAGDRRILLVRHLEVPQAIEALAASWPIRVLGIASAPPGEAPLDLEREKGRLEAAIRRVPGVRLEFLPRADLACLRAKLLAEPAQVVHFMGHGSFDPATGQGELLFEGEHGAVQKAPGPVFASTLADLGVRLVVLNACNSGSTGGNCGAAPFGGVATALVRGGLLAVVAMQFPISDTAALCFATAFYERIAALDPVDAALAEARRRMHEADQGSFEWATPVLYLRAPDGRILDRVRPTPASGRFEWPVKPGLAALASGATQTIAWASFGLLGLSIAGALGLPVGGRGGPSLATAAVLVLVAGAIALFSDRALAERARAAAWWVRGVSLLAGWLSLILVWHRS